MKTRPRVIVGLAFTVGAPWEPASGSDWRLHAWRNRPCCFLHFEVYRPPQRVDWLREDNAKLQRLGGRLGYFASRSTESPIGFPNHVRFAWRGPEGSWYVATLHSFGMGTKPLLGRLIRELVPARTAGRN
jgi:hypothetical protein